MLSNEQGHLVQMPDLSGNGENSKKHLQLGECLPFKYLHMCTLTHILGIYLCTIWPFNKEK